MKILKIVLLLYFSTQLCSCQTLRTYYLIGQTKVRYFKEDSLKFTSKNDLWIVQVKINDQETLYDFVFDTGASISLIDSSLLQNLNLKKILQISVGDAQGIKQKMGIYQLDSFKIGKVNFQKVAFVSSESELLKDLGVHGIIGANILKKMAWKLDFQKNMLTLSKALAMPAALEIPFSLHWGLPYLGIRYKNSRFPKVLFDTAYNGAWDLPLQKARKNPDLRAFLHLNYQEFISQKTLFGEQESLYYLTELDEIFIYKQSIKNFTLAIGKTQESKIGNAFFKHKNTLIIDYLRKKISFQ